MNRYLTFSLAVSMSLSTLAIPLRAATPPRAGEMENPTRPWTNEDLGKLRPLGLISIVGQPATADASTAVRPRTYVQTQDPEWYAEQAAKLRAQLERRQAELQRYRQALEDATSLKPMTSGVNLYESHIGATPEEGIEILQQRVGGTETELDALEDLARHNGISPGALRGQGL
jgi:hypothetical protein